MVARSSISVPLLYMHYQCWRGVVEPGHVRDVVDGLNVTNKMFISMLMTTVKLPGAAAYESYMVIHTSTANTDISL